MSLLIAHGLSAGRADLPIPQELFAFVAAAILLISFVGLASLWPQPRLQGDSFWPLPRWLSRALCNRVLEVVCGLVGVFLLGAVVWTGIDGIQNETANFAPTFVMVTFWVGMVPLSVVFGDVFTAFNPWRAIARFVAFFASSAAGEPLPAPMTYPKRLGYWPAALGILAFAALELVAADGRQPENIAIATLIYSVVTFVGMALYGIDAWLERGEAFSVYYGLFARISPLCVRDGRLGLRLPFSGLTGWGDSAGSVVLLSVMIGSTSFDGARDAPVWTTIANHLADFFRSFGMSPKLALESAFMVGLVAVCLLVYGFYRLGVIGMRSVGGGFSATQLSRGFVHTLVPIAVAYVSAHYLTYLLFNGQSIAYLASNPLGREGTDLFGTANDAVDYGLIGAKATWYYQVAFVVVGHVAALSLAHDRALAVYDRAKLAVRSQYWMLTVMVGFTSLALWLLSQAS